jgi:hypothetical protein
MLARLVVIALALALVGNAGVARAEERPWAVGVPAKDQQAAFALYEAGNKFFVQAEYKDALVKYEQALALWDHPAIRYNAAVCLINLDRTLEAYENIQAALRYGPAPLAGDLYNQGVSYQKLLAGRVGEIDVTGNEPDAEVTLDGKLLFHGVGHVTRRLLTGEHLLVATKPQYQTETTRIVLNAGDKQTFPITLKRLASARVLHRRWNKWVPWSVLVGGAVVGLLGGVAYSDARKSETSYDSWITSNCHPYCPKSTIPSALIDGRDRAASERIPAISALAVGSAVFAAGFVLVIMNQPRLGPVTPTVGNDHVGLVISGRW